MNIGKQVAVNFIWRFLERFGARLVSVIVSVALARVLMPEIYGLVTLASIFIEILQVFIDHGIGTALVRKNDADDIDFSTAFIFNISVSILLYVVVFVAAPFIANFYNNPEIIHLVRILGIIVLIAAPKNILESYIARNMLFKKFFFATLSGTIISAIVGLTMAYNGFGVWSLVAQHLLNIFIDTIVLFFSIDWKPKLIFSYSRLNNLLAYSWKILVSVFIDKIYNELIAFVIGKKYSPADLAYYGKGQQFPKIIMLNINSSLDSILLPTLANVQNNNIRIKEMVRKSIKTSTFIMMPIMLGLASCSTSIVKILLTEKWIPCIPFIYIFCIAFIIQPIQTTNLNAIKALGKSDLFLKLCIIQKSIGIALTIAAMNHGAIYLAISYLLTLFISLFVNCLPSIKLLNYTAKEQIFDLLPQFLLSLFMALCIYPISKIDLNDYLILIIQIPLGIIIYIIGSKLMKIESLNYVFTLAKSLIGNHSK